MDQPYQDQLPLAPPAAEQVTLAANWLKKALIPFEPPRIGLILGSGLSQSLQGWQQKKSWPYSAIPFFPHSTVPGHPQVLSLMEVAHQPLLVFHGRCHYYEGYSFEQVTRSVRLLAALGVSCVILTNAAGSLHPEWNPGQWLLISDHLNLMGQSPLRGPLFQPHLPRFVDLSETYDLNARNLFQDAAQKHQLSLVSGVYAAVPGPHYETPAEVKMLQLLGADAVGMSTIPEVLVAKEEGLRVVAFSCLTNRAAGLSPSQGLSHQEVLETAERSSYQFNLLIQTVLPQLF